MGVIREPPLAPSERDRYLRVLGVGRRPASLGALAAITQAQVTRVPFENVSKLYHLRRSDLRGVPDLATYLDGVERHRLGGTCYTTNLYLHRLLVALGYDASLCGADMRRPDVHVVNLVRVEGREYVVDAGYGAPFLTPLPRDLPVDVEVALGQERYVLRPQDAEGRSRLELRRDGALRHGYVLTPAARRIAEFESVIRESFAPSATFLNALVIARFAPGRSLVLRNLTLTESSGPRSAVSRLPDASSLPTVVRRRFGIPEAIVRAAVDGLPLSEDPWG